MRQKFFMAFPLLVMTGLGITVIAQAELRPARDFDSLFDTVQMEQILKDSKDFPDSVPKYPPEEVMRRCRMMLELFVEKHFVLPGTPTETFNSDREAAVEDHIDRLWPVLTREPDREERSCRVLSLAAMHPLFFQMAEKERAGLTINRIEGDFLKKGGAVTTLTEETGQQWDRPNG